MTDGLGRMRIMARWVVALAAIVGCAAVVPATAQARGPIILAGIDAEDGGVGGHGPIENYATMAQSILGSVQNGGKGILVFGGGPDTSVAEFWNMVGARTGQPVTFAFGPAAASQPLAGFAMIGVASSVHGTSSGGLTDADNTALVARKQQLVDFINGGGGLLGFSQSGFTEPYAYVGFGGVKVNVNVEYSDITPDFYGPFSGVTDALDICCWHDTYVSYPGFMRVLGVNTSSSEAAVIGGLSVNIDEKCSAPRANRPAGCGLSQEEQFEVIKEAAAIDTPIESSLALVACETGRGKGIRGRRKKLLRAGARALCDGALTTAYALAQTAIPSDDTAKLAELPEVGRSKTPKLTDKLAGCAKRDKTCRSGVKAFKTYLETTGTMNELLKARAIATNRLDTAKRTSRPDVASLQLGAVKAFSAQLEPAIAKREKAGATLAKRLKKARVRGALAKKRILGARTKLAGPRARGGKVALKVASSGLLANTTLAPLLASRTLGTIPLTKNLDFGKLVGRKQTATKKVHKRLAQHVQLAELRRMLDAIAARNQVPVAVKPTMLADLDQAACAGTAAARVKSMQGFLDKARKSVTGKSKKTLAVAGKQLLTYRQGISDPLGECKPAPPLLPPPPPPPTPPSINLTPSSQTRTVGETAPVEVTVRQNSAAAANKRVRWTVTGANPSTGSAATDASGEVTINLTATQGGEDVVTAYVDVNDNNAQDGTTSEPQDTARVVWNGPATGDVTERGFSSDFQPFSIATAGDGTMWATGLSGRIAKIGTDGAIQEFTTNRPPGRPLVGIVETGGQLWVTEQDPASGLAGSGFILRFDPASPGTPVEVVSLETHNPPGCTNIEREPVGITAVSGTIYFTTSGCSAIGRVTGGTTVAFASLGAGVPTPGATSMSNRAYRGIAYDAGTGALYAGVASNIGNGRYAKVPVGSFQIEELPLPSNSTTSTNGERSYAVAIGQDGDAYFTGPGSVYRVDLGGPDSVEITGTGTSTAEGPQSIISGPRGDLWWTESSGTIDRLPPGGAVPTRYTEPSSSLRGLTAGTDGHVWYLVDSSPDKVGRLLVLE